jgi:23S rRNA pseudouridine2605 synthase
MEERVQKFISSAGFASRRKAEEFIRSGQVSINGHRAKLGDKVNPETDRVTVYGKEVGAREQYRYLVMNKPAKTVVSRRDPRGRKTVFSLLPEDVRNTVWNVGRLDYETEGLLVFTNDGDLTQQLAHPSFEHDKEYEVLTAEEPTDAQLEHLRTGVDLPTGTTSPAKVKTRGGKVYITIHEGKKRQVRRMFDGAGLSVSRLKRIRMGSLHLPQNLKSGEVIEVQKSDIIPE